MGAGAGSEVTTLLRQWSEGEEAALPELMELLYDDLRRVARRHFRAEGASQTLQPTALVHEIYMELARQRKLEWKDRVHFCAVVSLMMRRFLVKRARHRRARKREGVRVTLSEGDAIAEGGDVDVLTLHDALTKLEAHQPRAAKVVEMAYFAGMTQGEIAEHLGLSIITVKRDWKYAKCWLLAEIEGE